MENLKIVEFNKKYQQLAVQCRDTLNNIQQETGIQFDVSVFDDTAVDMDSILNIVFVGQYSAGKSSIIKMLTQDEGIEVGAAITTQSYTPYEWNNMYIVDTPGIQTGIREDHDAITEEAIQKADLIVFVITNELFNPTVLRYFNKLAYDMGKGKKMILVINKMVRGGEPEVLLEDLQRVLSQPYGQYPLLPLDTFRPCFIDAQSYLDALDEADSAFRQDLLRQSHYDDFVCILNDFADEKGLYGRFVRKVQIIEDTLDAINERIEATCESNREQEQNLNDLLFSIKESKRCEVRKLKDLYQNARQSICYVGAQFASTIGTGSSEELEQSFSDAQNQINDILDKVEAETQNIVSEIMAQSQDFGIQLENQVSGMTDESFAFRDNAGDSANVEGVQQNFSQEFVNGMANATMSILNNGYTKDLLIQGLKTFKYNTWLDKLPLIGQGTAKATAAASKLIPVIGAAIQVAVSIGGKIAEDNRLTKLAQLRADIRKNYDDYADQVYKQGMQHVVTPIVEELDKAINETERALFVSQQQSDLYKQVQQKIQVLRQQCQLLLNELDSAQ